MFLQKIFVPSEPKFILYLYLFMTRKFDYIAKLFFSLFLLPLSLFSQDTLKVFKGTASEFVVDNEGNILAFFPAKKVLKKYLSQYDSVITFSGYDEIPLSGECKIALNTRQEIYLLDIGNSRLLVLSKDLRPLTAFYFDKEDLPGLPWDCEISRIAVSVKGFLYLGDSLAGKIYIFDNFWKKIDEREIKVKCEKLLVFENGEVVCVSREGLCFLPEEKLVFQKGILDAALYNETLFLLFPDGIYVYANGKKQKIQDIQGNFSGIFVAGKVFLLANGKYVIVF